MKLFPHLLEGKRFHVNKIENLNSEYEYIVLLNLKQPIKTQDPNLLRDKILVKKDPIANYWLSNSDVIEILFLDIKNIWRKNSERLKNALKLMMP